jgi:DNA-binding response OmpR family regulator
VVDDEPLVCDMTRCRLEHAGYRVQLMANCTSATAGLRERLANLLLLDVSLPDGSRRQLCRQLKHDPATACVPIVILTGWSMPELHAEAIAAGAADLLAKPFSICELHACVAQQLAHLSTALA